MKRRSFGLTSGSALLGMTSIGSVVQKPVLALSFTLNKVEDKDPSKLDVITVSFEKFKLIPRYINRVEEDAMVRIKISIEGHDDKTVSTAVSLTNGDVVTGSDLGSAKRIVKRGISSSQSILYGEIEVLVDHPDVSDSYKKSFNITSKLGEFSDPNSSSGSVSLSDLDGDGTKDNPYIITSDQELNAMSSDLSAHYKLGINIDASGMDSWNGGSGFNPIGDGSTPFNGSLDGDGYTIRSLYINRPSSSLIGLIGKMGGDGTLKNLSMTKLDVEGDQSVGGLVGYSEGIVRNFYVNGTVDGGTNVGGIAGRSEGSSSSNDARIEKSRCDANISGSSDDIGSIVGYSYEYLTISQCYATGDVSGSQFVGGIIGSAGDHSLTENCYFSGSISADNQVGGICGESGYAADLRYCYFTGDVSGSSQVGGIVGRSYGNVTNNYSVGSVPDGSNTIGGIAGFVYGTLKDSYMKDDPSASVYGGSYRATISGDLQELSESEMSGDSASSNMSSFDFTSNWDTVTSPSDDFPILTALDKDKQLDNR